MKKLLIALCGLFFGVAVIATPPFKLGAKECTWGPSYWCSNITNAKNCNAVTHCIQTVWEKHPVPEDNDSICQICLDMVKQARDQLESNETQDDLKAVFDGSCKLIPIKPVQNECIKLVDDFIPELIEALASQMNPQTVCSVAGLCNNVAIDKLLEEYKSSIVVAVPAQPQPEVEDLDSTFDNKFTCNQCNSVAKLITDKFETTDRDIILENMLLTCGKLSSFSDACANIVLTYFNDIYNHMAKSFNNDNICHMTGVCSDKYHSHPENVEIRPMSDVGFVPVKADIPCELCEQLVTHLRDLLIANTTELEFKQVLQGLCKQTKSFSKECISIVDQYYDVIYQSLVNDLDPNGACFMIGICQKGLHKSHDNDQQPIMPLIKLEPATVWTTIREIKDDEPKRIKLGQNEPILSKEQINSAQLPIDLLVGAPNPDYLVNSGELCTLCEYFLHFLQEELSTPKEEEYIKNAVLNTCNKFPKTVKVECHNFVEMYGDAVIALLIQNIDPREVCPLLKFCPSNIKDTEVFAPVPIDVKIDSHSGADKPTCPLCLFAVTELKEVIQSNKSKENIKHALNDLCSHLPTKIRSECKDFVETYSSELINLLIEDFTSQQICIEIKLCTPEKVNLDFLNMKTESAVNNGDVLTNEIPDDTVNGQFISNNNYEYQVNAPDCILCEEIVKEAEKRLGPVKTKKDIITALGRACDKVKKYKAKCHSFIDTNGDKIADFIMKEIEPKVICRELGYCNTSVFDNEDDLEIDEAISVSYIASPNTNMGNEKISLPEISLPLNNEKLSGISMKVGGPFCFICVEIMNQLDQMINSSSTTEDIKTALDSVCDLLPKASAKDCDDFVNKYTDLIMKFIGTTSPRDMCMLFGVCEEIQLESKREIIECAVCHESVRVLDNFLNGPDFHKIENRVERICNELPSKYIQKCTNMLDIYLHSMINLLIAEMEQQKVCSKIGMCYPNEVASFAKIDSEKPKISEKKLLGANECTFGPSYWCQNKQNAIKCKAEKFCIEKHWVNGVAPLL